MKSLWLGCSHESVWNQARGNQSEVFEVCFGLGIRKGPHQIDTTGNLRSASVRCSQNRGNKSANAGIRYGRIIYHDLGTSPKVAGILKPGDHGLVIRKNPFGIKPVGINQRFLKFVLVWESAKALIKSTPPGTSEALRSVVRKIVGTSPQMRKSAMVESFVIIWEQVRSFG